MKRLAFPMFLAAALPAADSNLPPAINSFTSAAYRQLARGDGNLILSPFNIATALSMALSGAGGKTAEEIQSVLHLRYDSEYDARFGALVADLNKAGNLGENQLHAANGLWVQKGFAIRATFEDGLRNNYRAPLTPLDFVANPEGARSQVNRWTEEKTKGRIKDLFPAGSFDRRTRLVLTSAIYFYGKWQLPFVTSQTHTAPFIQLSGASSQASFMNQRAHLGYTETPSAQILELRYAGSGMAFDVLLPNSRSGLRDLEASLTSENLSAWLGSLTSRDVLVSLPKFRVESEFSLSKQLSAMGMPTAFSDKADFSGIDPEGRLAISEVVHKAFVDVSEAGTEAAAATGVMMHLTSARMPEPAVIFNADHPFLFLIRDTRTGVVLFVGRLMNPQ